jgi:hypothetical protein
VHPFSITGSGITKMVRSVSRLTTPTTIKRNVLIFRSALLVSMEAEILQMLPNWPAYSREFLQVAWRKRDLFPASHFQLQVIRGTARVEGTYHLIGFVSIQCIVLGSWRPGHTSHALTISRGFQPTSAPFSARQVRQPTPFPCRNAKNSRFSKSSENSQIF